MLNIVIIGGSNRPGKLSGHAVNLIAKLAGQNPNFKVDVIDPSTFPMPEHDGNNAENRIPEYTKLVNSADGFIVVTPEYNHGYPASIKRILDTEWDGYQRKPVILAGVSDGNWGGVRVIENILPVVRAIGLLTTRYDIQFPKVAELFNEQGELQDQELLPRIDRALAELEWLATTLKYGRENSAK